MHIKRWMKNWEFWREGILASTLILLIYKIIENAYPIWQEINLFFEIIRPFIIGFVIAYLLNAPCNIIEKRLSRKRGKGARGFSVLIVYLSVIVFLTVIISYILPIIAVNILEFVNYIPLYLSYFVDNIGEHSWVIAFLVDVISEVVMNLNVMQEVLNHIGSGLNSIGEYARVMTTGIFHFFLSLIISVYVLLYKDQILELLNRMATLFIKEKPLNSIKRFLNKSSAIFYKFVACQFIDACIVGIISIITLTLLNVEYAVTLGVIIGICNMIPYFGSIFASVITVVITVFTGGFNLAVIVGVFLLIMQQVDGNIIGPRLMRDALDINPILIIFAITVGGAYFGVMGMFLSVPVAAITKIIINHGIDLQERKIKKSH